MLLTWLFQSKRKYNVVSNTLVTEFEDVLTRDKNIKQFNDFKGVKEQFGIDILTPKEYLIKVGALK